MTLAGIGAAGEAEFIARAKAAGVAIAAAWPALAPDFRDARGAAGLYVRLTFPAVAAEDIARGLETLARLSG